MRLSDSPCASYMRRASHFSKSKKVLRVTCGHAARRERGTGGPLRAHSPGQVVAVVERYLFGAMGSMGRDTIAALSGT